jgi:DNA-binding beta-propeller fold protein YncE
MLLLLASPIVHAGAIVVHPIALSKSGVVTLDYFAWDPVRRRLWIPAGNTGDVVVLDADGRPVKKIAGFATKEFELQGKKGRLGPSSVALSDGDAFVGNRGDSTICVIDTVTLVRVACHQIAATSDGWAAAPDAVVYVPTTREVWITRGAPPLGIASSDGSITILDATRSGRLREKGKIKLQASAEGYAVDARRGRFYTNLEESGETVVIDVRQRKIVGRWKSGCDEARGLALDRNRNVLFVACSSRVVALDVARGGKVLATIATGDGLDNIDYSEADGLLYAAAANAAVLTIAKMGQGRAFTAATTVTTVKGARSVVAGDRLRAYVADPLGGRILVVSQPAGT